jgi:hypothetical protein
MRFTWPLSAPLVGLLIGLTCITPHHVRAADKEDKTDTTAVRAVVEKWLALVDAGAYSESWKKSSELFRTQVKKDEWKDKISKVRGPLGKLVKRELRLKQTESSLPGVPDGHYVIFQYVTTFENKQNATETVTPHLDKDNHWRVSGYVIR